MRTQVTAFVTDVKSMLHGVDTSTDRTPMISVDQSATGMTEEQLGSILNAIKGQEHQLEDEMETLKKMIAVEHG